MALILNGNGTVDTGTMVFGNGDITGLSAGALPSNVIGAGAVLQVVQATYSTEVQIASTTYSDTGLSASITPTSATSKILVLVSQIANAQRATNSSVRGDVRLMRNSTEIFAQVGAVGIRAGIASEGDIVGWGMYSGAYLDSPATTSSVTYKTQGKVNTTSNSGFFEAQGGDTSSSMILMEIAG